MSKPLLVEVIAYAPTAFYHCTHCEVAWRTMGKSDLVQREQLASSLPPDLAQEYLAVSNWVREQLRRHCHRIVVKVIDAASVEGVFKALRYNARRYPAVIVDGKTRFVGANALEAAAQEIGRRLQGEATAIAA